jgi:hypothetical protein
VQSLQKGEDPRDYVRRVLLNESWSHPSDRLIFLVVVLLDVGDRFWIRKLTGLSERQIIYSLQRLHANKQLWWTKDGHRAGWTGHTKTKCNECRRLQRASRED